jgi:glycosyltransferase involved in cell wall biosynthesis
MTADRTPDPLVSVIVPVRNGADHLPGLLECLDRQTLSRQEFEIVVGDDGSTDGATDALSVTDDRITVVRGEPRNAYTARNRAIAAARGRVLALCDADCRPEPEWLAQGLAALEDWELAAGRIRIEIPPDATVWSLLDAESAKNHERLVTFDVAETANLFFRRELFERVGPFDDRQPGYGDYEFVKRCVRSGARLAYAPQAVVSHPVRTSGRAVVSNLWSMNESYATFESRAGRVPQGVWLRSWVPALEVIRGRRRAGMSPVLDQRWFAANGYEPGTWERFQALPLTYLVLPYLASVAQAVGWWRGRSKRAVSRPPEVTHGATRSGS